MRVVVGVAVSVALAVVAVLALGAVPTLIPALALAAAAPALTRTDVAEHRLPNRLVAPALAAGIVGVGLGWLVSGWNAIPVIAAAAYAGVLLVLALFGGMGMGDVKLAAGLGLASPSALIALGSPLLAFLLGGGAAVVVLVRSGPKARIAFGPFLLAGYFGALIVVAIVRLS